MAKTNKPLRVLVHPSLMEIKGVQELIERQNDVTEMSPFEQKHDLILGPNCWRICSTEHGIYIALAIKAARQLKYTGSK